MFSSFKFSRILLFLLILFSFSFGLIEIIGVPRHIISLSMDVVLLLFILNGALIKTKTTRFNWHLLLLVIISILSLLTNNLGLLLFIIFCKKILIIFLITPVIIKTFKSYSNYLSSKINYFFIFICFLQIGASVVKFFVWGFSENYVGTMSIDNGSLAVLFPLLFLAFNYHRYGELNNRVILLTILSLIVPILSLKRAIILILPLLLFIISIFKGSYFYKMKKMVFSFIGLITILLLSLNLNSKFKTEVGGSINIVNIVSTYIDYESREGENEGVVISGRISSFGLIKQYFSNLEMTKTILGLGPGYMIKSGLVQGQKNILYNNLNLGYGSRIGLYWIFFQLGILGCIIYFTSFYFLLNFKRNTFQIDKELKILILVILVFDLFYSSTLLENYTGLIFLSLLIALSNLRIKSNQINGLLINT